MSVANKMLFQIAKHRKIIILYFEYPNKERRLKEYNSHKEEVDKFEQMTKETRTRKWNHQRTSVAVTKDRKLWKAVVSHVLNGRGSYKCVQSDT